MRRPDDRYAFGLAVPHELPDDTGLAHVVEHLVGHGPRARGARYLLPRLVDRGTLASFTGLTYRPFTCYVGTAGGGAVDRTLDLLAESCLDPPLDPAAIAIEAGSWDDGEWVGGSVADELQVRRQWLRDAFSEVTSRLYAGSPLAHDPGGLLAALPSAGVDRVRAFHRRWYRPGALVRCVVDPGGGVTELSGRADASWQWEPRTVHASLTVPGRAGALALGWRLGLHPPVQRAANVALARALAALLSGRRTRADLASEGWRLLAGPIVDTTTPDPCVLAVLGVPPGRAPDGDGEDHDVVAGRLRAALAASTEPPAAVTRSLGRPEPLLDDPWACLGVHALASAVLTGSGEHGRVDPARTWEGLHHLLCGEGVWEGRPGRAEVVCPAVGPPPGPVRVPVPGEEDRSHRSPPGGRPQERDRSGVRYSERSADRLRSAVALDTACWPGGRITVMLRWYPGDDATWWSHEPRALAGVVAAHPLAAWMAPAELGAAVAGDAVRGYAEWRWSAPSPAALHDQFAALASPREKQGEEPAATASRHPAPGLIAAALAGAPAARHALELHGSTLPAAGAVAMPRRPMSGLVTVAVSGLGGTAGDLDRVAHGAAERLSTWLGGASSGGSPPLDQLTVEREADGCWLLAPTSQGAPPGLHLAVAWQGHAVPPAALVTGAIADLRYAWRDLGVYASGGHLAGHWRAAVAWAFGPRAAQLAGSLAGAFGSALERLAAGETSAAPTAPRLPARPGDAVEALLQELHRRELAGGAGVTVPAGDGPPGEVAALRAPPG